MAGLPACLPILDPATRTAPLEVEIPNPQARLKPGMYAKITLEIDSRDNVLIIPKISLVDSEGKRGIYQPNDESRAAFKPVTVGLEDNEKAEILEGLREGDIDRFDRRRRASPQRSTGRGGRRRRRAGAAAGGRGGSWTRSGGRRGSGGAARDAADIAPRRSLPEDSRPSGQPPQRPPVPGGQQRPMA